MFASSSSGSSSRWRNTTTTSCQQLGLQFNRTRRRRRSRGLLSSSVSPKTKPSGTTLGKNTPPPLYDGMCHANATTASQAAGAKATGDERSPPVVKITAVVGEGRASHFRYPGILNQPPPTWFEVFTHLRALLRYTDETYELRVLNDSALLLQSGGGKKEEAVADVGDGTDDLVLWVGVSGEARAYLEDRCSSSCSLVGFEHEHQPPSSSLSSFTKLRLRGGGNGNNNIAWLESLPFFGKAREALERNLEELWRRKNADDLLYLVLVLINACVRDVPRVSMTEQNGGGGGGLEGLGLLWCMLSNCRTEVFDCVSDEECKAALDCLTDCGLNDQVCSYQCIVSHESPKFEKFSQCVLQKHNCMNNKAEIPALPEVEPMELFRNKALTHPVAEDILVGWLGEERHSWKVVTGQNAAYDIFPNQHQIFYRGKRKKQFWYDPVFQAKTLGGELVWRRRHYRVRRGKTAGTFYFSVLDNGVISNEYWRIVDVCDELSWCVLYYSGAASTAGQAYTGAVFVTRDGKWPEGKGDRERIREAHSKCGIQMWELFEVDNCDCPDAPLDPLEE